MTKINISDRFYNLKCEFKRKLNKLGQWIYYNKDLIIILGPAVIGGTSWIVKTISRRAALNKQESIKNLYCYDRSLGHYWKLKRELTNDEWVRIEKRKRSGERLADILDEMKVLK